MRASFGVVARRVVSWLIIVQAILIGMLVIAVLGATWNYGSVFPVALNIISAGITPILLSFVAMSNPGRAAHIALWVSPISILLIFRFPWGYRAGALIFAGALVAPGLIWLITSRRNWPLPFQSVMFARNPRLATISAVAMICVLVVIAALSSLFLPWWPPIGDCGGKPLLTERGAPRNIDFTAKVVFVGPSSFLERSLWSIARVEHRFGDLKSGPANLIILRGFFQPKDKSERYFVEGVRTRGVLTRFLPIFEPVDCGRTAHLDDAGVALRVLHDGPPLSGGRLIGRVYGRLEERRPEPGVSVLAKGPAGSIVSVTDAQGIVDFIGLPPGQYTVEPLTTLSNGRNLSVGLDLKFGDVKDFSLYLE